MIYKKYIKTSTGKVVKTALVDEFDVKGEKVYATWTEIFYGMVATFTEEIIDTNDSMEELLHGSNQRNKGYRQGVNHWQKGKR